MYVGVTYCLNNNTFYQAWICGEYGRMVEDWFADDPAYGNSLLLDDVPTQAIQYTRHTRTFTSHHWVKSNVRLDKTPSMWRWNVSNPTQLPPAYQAPFRDYMMTVKNFPRHSCSGFDHENTPILAELPTAAGPAVEIMMPCTVFRIGELAPGTPAMPIVISPDTSQDDGRFKDAEDKDEDKGDKGCSGQAMDTNQGVYEALI